MITKMVIGRPPVWKEAHKHFDINDNGTIYTYGETLYNPASIPIDPALMAHENVHSGQQMRYPGGPATWWQEYFKNGTFRKEQEIEAYRIQYGVFCKFKTDRNIQAKYLHELALIATSEMYKLDIDLLEAIQSIGRK